MKNNISKSEHEVSRLLAPWLTRRSKGPKYLCYPAPCATELRLMLEAAANVPDHCRLGPCRIVVTNDAQREALASAFSIYAASTRGLADPVLLDPEVLENERAKAFNAPCLLAIMAKIDGAHLVVPDHEQWITVGASLGALLTSANALGYVGKTLSGARTAHPAVQAVFCKPSEVLVCFVYVGTRREPVDSPGIH